MGRQNRYPDVKLGKKEQKVDARTLRLGKYLDARYEAPPQATAAGYEPPSSRHWDTPVKGAAWGMLGNDTLGDCTCATVGHMTQAWRANDEGVDPSLVTTEDVVSLYSAWTGYDPRDPNTDQGAYCLDILNHWRRQGLGNRPPIQAFVQVDLKDNRQVKAAIDLFGGLYLGVGLPISAQRQDVWKVPLCRWCPNSQPWSWGGHAVPAIAYSSKRLWVVTWSQIQPITWGFLRRYCDEGYAVLSSDWTGLDAVAPVGFNLTQLQIDLNNIPHIGA